MLFQTEILYPKVETPMIITKLEKLLNLVKIKILWDQIQIQVETCYKIHFKPTVFPALKYLLIWQKTLLAKCKETSWIFLIKAISSRKSTSKNAMSKKCLGFKSFVTITSTGTQSRNATTEITWRCNRRYCSWKYPIDTFNIKNLNNIKLLDLNFQYLFYSTFVLYQKDKREYLLQKLLARAENLYTFEQIHYLLKNVVLLFSIL